MDLGTNNCRLLVARPSGSGFRVIDAFSRIVRLGEGLEANGALSDAAIERTLAALKVCARKIRRRRVTRVRGVATQACRTAANCEDFLDLVEAETGIRIDTITSYEEAELGIASCSALLDPGQPYALMFDIGGGSTEVSWLDLRQGEPRLVGAQSIPLGVVNAAERYDGRRLTPAGYRAIVDHVRGALEPFHDAHDIAGVLGRGAVQMVGTSGTVTTLTGIHMDLPRYDRNRVDGAWLGFADMQRVICRLSEMTYEERTREPCVGVERADLVLAGCAILEGICELWPVGRVRVADRGLREGILMSLMAQDRARRRRAPCHAGNGQAGAGNRGNGNLDADHRGNGRSDVGAADVGAAEGRDTPDTPLDLPAAAAPCAPGIADDRRGVATDYASGGRES